MNSPAQPSPDTGVHRPPARLIASAFGGVVLGMIGFYAAFTAAPLLAEDLTGARTWIGLPGAAVILGTALGAVVLSEVMRRRGRRAGLTLGWVLGAAGAAGAVAAITAGAFALLVIAMLVVGLGHGANQLARFAAADTRPAHRQGKILSLVVWAGTIGAVVGPATLEPAARVAASLQLEELTGGLLVTITVFLLAGGLCFTAMRPDPSRFAMASPASPAAEGTGRSGARVAEPLDRTTLVAIAALVTAQFVMLLIMTITPVHVRSHDHALSGVGLVISFHVLGMFGFAPVAGWACDRFGALRVAFAGLVLVSAAAAGTATAPLTELGALTAALFFLGLGWSATFVASSTLLARAGVTVQGRADALGWAFAAGASLASGLLLDRFGYAVLSLVGIALALTIASVVLLAIRTDRAAVPA